MPLFGLSSPGPFFGNKVRAFWNLQILGWTGWLGLRGVSSLAGGQALDFLIPVVVSAITGFSVTLVLSVCYGALISKRPILMWGASFGLLIVATSLWAFIDAWVIQMVNANSESGFTRSAEHTSELQSLMRNSYGVYCLKKKTKRRQ